ncbi:hypothetical protein DL764_004311 [Monosporascus ibericus]|uniref:Uncharacterized protein n=1 Tax=Monosporascus ibericus TaxID=155417 RepID=A0A4Q4TDA8_9PEZI|nr:hypothetical protein DL764_004311 [Monosporascus ibericus]
MSIFCGLPIRRRSHSKRSKSPAEPRPSSSNAPVRSTAPVPSGGACLSPGALTSPPQVREIASRPAPLGPGP